MKSERAFSLIETLVAAAMLGLIAAGLMTTMSFAATQNARTRVHALAATEGQAAMDRLVGTLQVASSTSRSDAQLCELLVAGPLSAAGGGTAGGTCPALSLTSASVQGTAIRKTITLTDASIGSRPGLLATITISGPQLLRDLVFKTHVRR